MDSRVLITGATGFVGQHLVHQLLEQNHAIWILTRGERRLPLSWANRVEVMHGDLTDPSILVHAVANVTTVYHLAGELREPSLMHTVNVEGTRNLLAACEKSSVRHVVYLSSVGVMGTTQAGTVDENAPCRPLNDYEQSKYEAEEFALEWSEKTGVAVTALRPTIVFGERDPIAADSMLAWLRSIQRGRFVFFDHQAVANYIYVGDVVIACVQSVQASARGVFIVADSCSLLEFVSACANALQVPAPRFFVPLPLAYTLASLMQVILPNSPLTGARVHALSNRTLYRSSRIDQIGWRPIFGYRVGLQHTVAWYKRNKHL